MSVRFVFVAALTLLIPSSAFGQSKVEQEASRQLQFARQEIEEGNYEKALTSSDSALRLNPALHDAYMYRALAYEGLGDNKLAEGLLITYLEVSAPPEGEEFGEVQQEAIDALSRVQDKLGEPGGWGSAAYADAGAGGAAAVEGLAAPTDMPEYPMGSEQFLQWMVARQQWDTYETRTQVGAGLAVGGLVLAGVGAGLMAGMAAASSNSPNDANIEAFYAAGIASIFGGGTMAGIGLPMVGVNAARLGRMRKASESSSAGARLLIGPAGLAVRF